MAPRSGPPRIIVALDYARESELLEFVARVTPADCRLKVGLEAYTALGPRVVESLSARGFDVFLDLKFHDIPNTVRAACRVAADLGVWMLNVHALGGARMLSAAREGIAGLSRPPILIAVTVLTSQTHTDLTDTGIAGETADRTLALAQLAHASGMDGVVCAGTEAAAVRAARGRDFLIVTPGIRPAGSSLDDQRRTLTPGEALANGADFLVIGRPITQSSDPHAALETLNREIA